jgi:FAD/FMN-containing dehydrogenase
MSDLLNQLAELLGDKGFLQGDALKDHPACVFVIPRGLIRPDSTAQLSAAMKLCHAAGQAVVPQGGRTGLVGGQLAQTEEMIISLERMNAIEELDQASRTITVQAGVPLQVVQEKADDVDLMFALDLGARGTATIGGNIATNAGGNRVVRYGMARDMVLGLEAVLADGTVISSMNSVIKNNTGYDLKQLFIGSEGTLGIVTRAVLRLRPKSRSQNTALLAVEKFEHLVELLGRCDSALGGCMSSFEVMWNSFYDHIVHHEGSKSHRQPLPDNYPYYVIVEAMGGDPDSDEDRFNRAMEEMFEAGLVADAVLAKSCSEREQIWDLRDDVEALGSLYPFFVFDVSVPLTQMESYVAEIESKCKERWSDSRVIIFGHLGDGNIHVVVAMGSDSADARADVEAIIYGGLRQRNGIISAEHGIGLEKKSHLDVSRSNAEISLMQTLKQAMDPTGILNPGKVVDLPSV